MKILRIEDKYMNKTKSTYIYLLLNNNWLLLDEIKNSTIKKVWDYFINHIKNLDCVIISLNYIYRNMIYSIYPYAKVIIDRKEIICFYESVLGIGHKAYEEAAITFHSMSKDDNLYRNNSIEQFIYHFYDQEYKKQAINLYEQWQLIIPLNDKKIYKILRTIECFYDEILNYFEYKKIIKEDIELNKNNTHVIK